MIDVVLKMKQKEGAFSLYRGLGPTLFQIGPYVGCQFALYKFFVDLYDQSMGQDFHVGFRSLSCGAVSGAIAKTIVYPLDLCKKRLQMQGFHQSHCYKG